MLKSKTKWKQHHYDHEPNIDLPISTVIKRMLGKRGIETTEDAQLFLNGDLSELHDPFLFTDMKKAVDRIFQAIHNDEQIVVYGDYDADGVTATYILVKTLTKLGANVNYYIPNRFNEGYGPNEKAFMEAHQAGVNLIITVDTGIAAPVEAQLAKKLGMDLIITDHHEEQGELPDAYAILHPRLSETYPFDHLAGVGVAFKLAHALLGELPKEFLAYAAIGTVADLVPLIGENRMITKKGLDVLKHTEDEGLKALKKAGRLDGIINEESIGFVIGPRLNAVGRLQDASLAVDLLLEEDPTVAEDMAIEIEQLNKERQQLVSEIVEEAIEEIEAKYKDDHVILLAKENWNPGVLGIVASRIVNQYYRPTIVLGIDPDTQEAKGSARSIPSYDIFKQGMNFRDLFLQFGGHAQAAGMTVSLHQIDDLRQAFNHSAENVLSADDFQPVIEVEDVVDWKDIDFDFPRQLELLAPFGTANPKPYFQLNGLTLQQIKKIGAKQNHVKLTASYGDGFDSIELIGFQMGNIADQLTLSSQIDVVGEIEINEWNGHRKLQVKLKDIRCLELQVFDYRGKSLQQLTFPQNDTLAISFRKQDYNINIPIIPFEKIKSHIEEYKTNYRKMVFVDLPEDINHIEEVLSIVNAETIYACFQNKDSHFLTPNSTREHFKQLFKTFIQHKKIHESQKVQLAKAKGWTIQQLEFMLRVFFELNFVKMENGDMILKSDLQHQPLTDSITYQKHLKNIEIEKQLYYSTSHELKEWFQARNKLGLKEGELVHGL